MHCRGVVLQCRDGRRRLFYPIPAAYNCNIKEANLVFLIMSWPLAYSDITTMAHKDNFSDPHAEHAPRTEHAMSKVVLSQSKQSCLLSTTLHITSLPLLCKGMLP